MNRNLLGNALEKALTGLIEQRRKQPATCCGAVEIPLIGVVMIYNDAGVEEAKHAIVNAMNAQTRWDREKPLPWLPSLPIDPSSIDKLNVHIKKPDDAWLLLLCGYAFSLRQASWDPTHPGFDDFVAGVLASPQCLWQLNTAAALKGVRRKPLRGFNDKTKCWEKNLTPDQKCEEILARSPPEDRATPAP